MASGVINSGELTKYDRLTIANVAFNTANTEVNVVKGQHLINFNCSAIYPISTIPTNGSLKVFSITNLSQSELAKISYKTIPLVIMTSASVVVGTAVGLVWTDGSFYICTNNRAVNVGEKVVGESTFWI